MAGALQKMVEFRPQPQRVTCDRTGREATCYSSGLTASTGQQLTPLAWTSNLSQGFPEAGGRHRSMRAERAYRPWTGGRTARNSALRLKPLHRSGPVSGQASRADQAPPPSANGSGNGFCTPPQAGNTAPHHDRAHPRVPGARRRTSNYLASALDGAQATGGWAAGRRGLGSSPGLASSPPSRKSTPFRLHLFCCGGSPIPLPPELNHPITEAQWDGFTAAVHALTSSADPPAAYGREIALCSAGATAKKDAVLFELRLKLHSTLLPHMLTYVRLIEDYEGELLGKRPQGSLARKARGVPTNTE